MKSFANIDTATNIVKNIYPNAIDISFIEHGYDNLVALVDGKYAFKFPRNRYAYLRDEYEELVLRDLDSLTLLTIPKVLGKDKNPYYFITSFVPGDHLNTEQVRNLQVKKQQKVADKIAQFAFAMHSKLSVNKAMDHRRKLKLDTLKEEPWIIYFENKLNKITFPNNEQNKLAKEYYTKWKALTYLTPEVVVHDDLHNENLMFEGTNLVGIVDFGDTNIGHPEQEFRQMYRISEVMLDMVIQSYGELSHFKLNKEASILWAILQELAVYSEMLTNTEKNRPSYFRAAKNLQKWLPEGNWQIPVKDTNNFATKQ